MSVLYIYGIAHPNVPPFNDNLIYVLYGLMLIVGTAFPFLTFSMN
jgi:hypothetical protein